LDSGEDVLRARQNILCYNENMTAKTIWPLVAVLAILPYVAVLVLYPYVRSGGLGSVLSFLMLFLPPSLIFGVILSFLADSGEGRYNPKVMIRILFLLNLLFYSMLLYSIFTYV
jgi:hypothetical protein